MKKNITIVIVTLSVIYAFTLFLPREMRVEKKIDINAPEWIIFSHVENIYQWQNWNPWMYSDTSMIMYFSEEFSGEGAFVDWESEKYSAGHLEITSVFKNEYIYYTIYHTDWSFEVKGEILLRRTPTGCRIFWIHKSDMGYNPFYRMISPFIERSLRPNMEEGLKNLKYIGEHNAKV